MQRTFDAEHLSQESLSFGGFDEVDRVFLEIRDDVM